MERASQTDPHIVLDDGYTVTRYIDGVVRLHAPVRVTFRPASAEQLEGFREKLTGEGVGNFRKICEATALRIVSWTAVGRNGEPLEVSAKNVRSLQVLLQKRLINVVLWGIDGGDADPEPQGDQSKAGDDDDIASIFAPATEDLETQRGN